MLIIEFRSFTLLALGIFNSNIIRELLFMDTFFYINWFNSINIITNNYYIIFKETNDKNEYNKFAFLKEFKK